MKPMTIAPGRILAGVANMLELLGFETTDREIALGMEAPYLFVKDDQCYRAGAGLYLPPWLNLYLKPRGFVLTEKTIANADVPAYLRKNTPVMLSLAITNDVTHFVVFSSYENERYHFINVKSMREDEPDTLSFTAPSLKRRLADSVTLYMLNTCTPEPVDFIPLLLSSLQTLESYKTDILSARERVMTREEFASLDKPLFRALFKDLFSLMILINEYVIAEELRQLNHDYKHVFTYNDEDSIGLFERLPRNSIKLCILWLRETIINRLYDLGADEALVDELTDSYHL